MGFTATSSFGEYFFSAPQERNRYEAREAAVIDEETLGIESFGIESLVTVPFENSFRSPRVVQRSYAELKRKERYAGYVS